ncbi:hypothetical protein [Clostridium transplantifaecale]|uniref:hypothetical protein n=1 Tax=Clostridium transplantifaecale TaxID=2479838 RepID=UPI0013DE2B00|nr:hypothetical protein [Clostridium transplantifaecale]
MMTQEELRILYNERLKREKQLFIAQETGICITVLSKFRNGKLDLYDYLFEKLEKYLCN